MTDVEKLARAMCAAKAKRLGYTVIPVHQMRCGIAF